MGKFRFGGNTSWYRVYRFAVRFEGLGWAGLGCSWRGLLVGRERVVGLVCVGLGQVGDRNCRLIGRHAGHFLQAIKELAAAFG